MKMTQLRECALEFLSCVRQTWKGQNDRNVANIFTIRKVKQKLQNWAPFKNQVLPNFEFLYMNLGEEVLLIRINQLHLGYSEEVNFQFSRTELTNLLLVTLFW